VRRRTLLRRAITRQQREEKWKQERTEISHPRAIERGVRGGTAAPVLQGGEVRGAAAWTLPWASSSGGRRRGGPAEGPSRSRGREHASSVEIMGRRRSLETVPWNYRASKPRSREQEVGGLRGVDAGQEWGLAGVDLQRGDGSTAAQRRGAGRGKSGADVLRFWVAAADGGRVQGRGAPDKRVARGSRRAGRAGDLRRGLRRPLPGGISAGTMGPTSGAGWSGGKE